MKEYVLTEDIKYIVSTISTDKGWFSTEKRTISFN